MYELKIQLIALNSINPINSILCNGRSPLTINEMRDPIARQPPILGHNKVRNEPENRNTGHDNRRIVEILPGDRKLIGREQHSNHPPIPEHANNLERLAEAPQTPLRLGEALGRAQEARETDQAVRCGAGHARGGNE